MENVKWKIIHYFQFSIIRFQLFEIPRSRPLKLLTFNLIEIINCPRLSLSLITEVLNQQVFVVFIKWKLDIGKWKIFINFQFSILHFQLIIGYLNEARIKFL